ncbi:hypothetical protein RI578_40730 (plasmid) [Streptomyces sp. BB1-1-1]|uniref:hypothetical protein n=1 Tax=unclassified Streptomyces TaxID=2593676 RepID=UPI0005DD4107|nr:MULTISPECIES: hypothetical protein [unclassified Streptomyces]OLO26032.1 hypothetical protein PZ61_0237325 [Streptomyces sp. MNU77]WND40619.1 hypothetical protein RI578_40730 [Streptomyces sp. BB1-1-1]
MTATQQQWRQRLSDLVAGNHSPTGDPVDAGARLVVSDPDGTEVFRAALARHHRYEDDGDQVIWIRPLVGGQDTGSGYLFNLGLARRRSLPVARADVVDDGVEIDLTTGQKARIEPADGPELEQLTRWDDFTNRLSPEEDAALGRLDADSWHGRYA